SMAPVSRSGGDAGTWLDAGGVDYGPGAPGAGSAESTSASSSSASTTGMTASTTGRCVASWELATGGACATTTVRSWLSSQVSPATTSKAAAPSVVAAATAIP